MTMKQTKQTPQQIDTDNFKNKALACLIHQT